MITMCRVMTGKDKVDSNLWFMGAAQRVGAATTRQVRLIWKYLSKEDSR